MNTIAWREAQVEERRNRAAERFNSTAKTEDMIAYDNRAHLRMIAETARIAQAMQNSVINIDAIRRDPEAMAALAKPELWAIKVVDFPSAGKDGN